MHGVKINLFDPPSGAHFARSRATANNATMNKGVTDFPARLSSVAAETEKLLNQLLGDTPLAGQIARPPRLVAAMCHSALDGGKRLRPFLLVEAAAVFGAARAGALMAGAALELVHCYSLVHDDLPAMDDDDLRRGRPTVHKAFDEATAILVGDALLTLAFDVMARSEVHDEVKVLVGMVSELARASGLGGKVGGQMIDLAAEAASRSVPDRKRNRNSASDENSALIRLPCRSNPRTSRRCRRDSIDRYGTAVGKAFQIADDLLDVEETPRRSAKPPARMLRRQATLVSARSRWSTRVSKTWSRSRCRAGAVRCEPILCGPRPVSLPSEQPDDAGEPTVATDCHATHHAGPPRAAARAVANLIVFGVAVTLGLA
jgi:farnesyl diphosphate synthase